MAGVCPKGALAYLLLGPVGASIHAERVHASKHRHPGGGRGDTTTHLARPRGAHAPGAETLEGPSVLGGVWDMRRAQGSQEALQDHREGRSVRPQCPALAARGAVRRAPAGAAAAGGRHGGCSQGVWWEWRVVRRADQAGPGLGGPWRQSQGCCPGPEGCRGTRRQQGAAAWLHASSPKQSSGSVSLPRATGGHDWPEPPGPRTPQPLPLPPPRPSPTV